MNVPGLRSAYDEVGGVVYFGRMLDKIRLKAAGTLPAGYHTGTRAWNDFDSRCSRFLGVKFAELKAQTLRGETAEALLQWCFENGRQPTEEEIDIWNTFMRKRGWNDEASGGLKSAKRATGLADRADILTWFDLFDAEEGR